MSEDNSSAKLERFGKLLQTLNQSELAMDSYELADMCWLLLNSPQIEEPTEDNSEQQFTQTPNPKNGNSGNVKPPKQTPVNTQNNPEPGNNQDNLEDNQEEPEDPQGELSAPQPLGKTAGEILTFPVDNPSDLGRSLGLARALKALLKRVPAQSRPVVLDEIETVENYAATNKAVLAPVFKPALEPWLEIALVVDGNASLDIWHQTIKDLILFLRNYGIFRDVRVWKLVERANKLILFKGLEIKRGIVSTPKELLNPNGRRIVIVLSDCVADYWHNGKICSLLEQWQQTNLLAILQMLPEWLWLKTGLAEGAKVTFFNDRPGVKNTQLRIKDILLWEDVFDDPKAINLPIFTLQAKSLEQWSALVAGYSDKKVGGFVFSAQNLAEHSSEEIVETETDPEEIILSFRNNSSPLAQELAELLAAVPTIFLPVVRLIRRKLLPEAGQTQVAEVFLGGLLKESSDYPPSTNPDLVLYDFVNPEVRKILQLNLTRSANINVFEEVSEYIAEQKGIELDEFLAELKKPLEKVTPNLQDVIYPFAKVSREILLNLGGDYARFAREELKAAGDKEKPKYDFSNFPELQDLEYESAKVVMLQGIELQTEEFQYASIVIEEEIYETFEFVTAKIDSRTSKIQRQTKQGKQLVEKLSDEVELEMVLISPGEFMMGDESSQQHQVNIDYSFLMGKYPITQAQWQAIMGNNPSNFKGEKRPVEQVSWHDAQEFCQRLYELTKRKYRLPSEAEWEYACRTGTTTPYHFGESITKDLANYNRNFGDTTLVNKFPANDFGLSDMHGNVWEWCEDDWHKDYKNTSSDGGAWINKESYYKVLRGGSWDSNATYCRAASRDLINPDDDINYIGFRVVCEVS